MPQFLKIGILSQQAFPYSLPYQVDLYPISTMEILEQSLSVIIEKNLVIKYLVISRRSSNFALG